MLFPMQSQTDIPKCELTIWTARPFHSLLQFGDHYNKFLHLLWQLLWLFPGTEKLLVIEAHLSFYRLEFSSCLLTGRMVWLWETFSNSDSIRAFTPFPLMSVNVSAVRWPNTRHELLTCMHDLRSTEQKINLKSLEVGGTSAWNIPRSSTAISHTSGTDLSRLSTPSIYTLLPFGVYW